MTRAIRIDHLVTDENIVALLRRKSECGAQLRLDSRAVQVGDIFLACPGIADDGRHHINHALERGASALLIHVDGADAVLAGTPVAEFSIPDFEVTGLRSRLGTLADLWYGQPSAHMTVIALTGTNGKTSCAQWIADAIQHEGSRAGVIGTLGVRFPDGRIDAGCLTTPDVVSVHRILAELLEAGASYAVMEASSIGIEQGRLAHVRIAVAAFTNLSRDHIDYHGSMQAYEQAKTRLFNWPGLQHAVINGDDEVGMRLASSLVAAHVTTLLFGIEGASDAPGSQHIKSRLRAPALSARDVCMGPEGIGFSLSNATGTMPVDSRMLGLHNVSNLLCVAGVLTVLGWDLERVACAFGSLHPVDGRLQQVDPVLTGQAVAKVVVDYAHTPDALERALQAMRTLANARAGRLWCVFGCGGNRDMGKRPLMGAIALRLADQVVVTSDNPRQESPDAIIAQIVATLPALDARVQIEPDRAQAIMHAVFTAHAADVVLLAGKGHETYQEVDHVRYPFDDRQWARAAMLLLQGRAIQTDSRRVEAGSVFLALRGDKFDGHDYLAKVAASGAVAAIVDQIHPEVPLAQVALGDTRVALLQLGRAWRRRFSIPLIAVTGSNGKTTTKEMIAAILSAWVGEPHRLATAGNLNNELGVPLTLLRLSAAHSAAVVELGMNHPGEIAVLAATAQPTVALVNNAQREHQEFMVDVQAVAVENGQVFAALGDGGVAVYPAHDAFTPTWDGLSASHAHLRFGLQTDADVRATDIVCDALGSTFCLHTGCTESMITLSVPGMHNLHNALAAAACVLAAGAPLSAVRDGLSAFHAVSGRMQPHRLPTGVVLIDDTYNANPDSVRAAIDVLASLKAPRVLVLGDMGEVGDNGSAMHQEVGAYARARGVEYLLTLGQATRESAAAFGDAAAVCESTEQVCQALNGLEAASILIKGSRFMRMERIVHEYLHFSGVVPEGAVNHAA